MLYFQSNEDQTARATNLYNEFKEKFAAKLGPDCQDTFENEYNCMFENYHGPDGPFPTAQWAVFVVPEDIAEFSWWIQQRRQEFSVLVHPNSGCEMEDHSDWAFWSGQAWPLDLTIMSHDLPFPWPEEE
eukprot:CAMPEP_0170565852 /NCGR_PEP_ID=MMETSP0211-20121228/79454_1 /TAXON_ID=311385 /ORGANISM="Pseudokeronopsis sp., Strain OXSARD2" /LENGTH=128 /DNA_ID=CAMNT_0010886837 /DNA_START=126 /DNA_END=512 /DNA_ORIENTATION=+